MPITRYPMSLIKNEESFDDADSSLSLLHSTRLHKQPIKGHNHNVHSLSGDFHQKHQVTPPKVATENELPGHFHLYSPPSSTTRISSAVSSHPFYQGNSSFSMSTRESQLPQHPFQSVESQMYKTEPQDSVDGTPLARGLDNFVNMYAPAHGHLEQRQQKRRQPNTGYPVSHLTSPLSPLEGSWGPQSNPARMFMNSTTLSTESTEGITAVRSVEHLEDPQHYKDEPFALSQEAYSFTWDIKDDRTVVESNKPKRRKLTASERARTKALKLAGGACENCRRKKKKCTHKDLSNPSGERQTTGENAATLPNQPPTVMDRDIQSRLYNYSGGKSSVLAYMGPEDDTGMHTPSDTPSYVGESGFNVPEFPLDTAEIGQQFDHQGRPPKHEQENQGGGDNSGSTWYRAMGYNADYMSHQYHQG